MISFRALEPAFLYSTQSFKFYNYSPSLMQTGLPRTLATGGSPTGDYHTIKVK
jgi:hypothetical protein